MTTKERPKLFPAVSCPEIKGINFWDTRFILPWYTEQRYVNSEYRRVQSVDRNDFAPTPYTSTMSQGCTRIGRNDRQYRCGESVLWSGNCRDGRIEQLIFLKEILKPKFIPMRYSEIVLSCVVVVRYFFLLIYSNMAKSHSVDSWGSHA